MKKWCEEKCQEPHTPSAERRPLKFVPVLLVLEACNCFTRLLGVVSGLVFINIVVFFLFSSIFVVTFIFSMQAIFLSRYGFFSVLSDGSGVHGNCLCRHSPCY